MKKVLLDSSVIIDFLRRKEKDQLFLTRIVRRGYKLTCSILTLSELYSGKSIWEDSNIMQAVQTLLADIEVFPISIPIALKAGQLRAYYIHDLIDAIIAATALKEKIPLATLNIKHFQTIRGLKLLEF